MEELKAIVCVGISASGKTTFAKELKGYSRIERDWIRQHIVDPGSTRSNYKFTKGKENEVSRVADGMIMEAFWRNDNIIISDTNLNNKFREALISKLEDIGYDVDIKVFDISLEEAWKRDAAREHGVGHSVIYSQYQRFLEFKEEHGFLEFEKYVPNNDLQDVLIVDIDGTIADMAGLRGPFEWDKVHLDKPRELIIDMISRFSDYGTNLILLSGRDSVCRELTEKWLFRNGVHYDELHMRPEKDPRKDTVVKLELFNKHIRNKYNVIGVIDDRPCVVRLWTDLGLPNVINVGDAWKEF